MFGKNFRLQIAGRPDKELCLWPDTKVYVRISGIDATMDTGYPV